jgi:hypothetical protein
MLIFGIFKNSSSTYINSAVDIAHACKFKCYISKSKLVLSKCNDLYFIAIAFIAFTRYMKSNSVQFFRDTRRAVRRIFSPGGQ